MNQEDYEQYQMQEQINQNNRDFQQNMYAPQLYEQMQQNQAVVINETNPKKVVEKIMLRLRGVDMKPDGTLVRIAKPKMNEMGLEAIWFWLDSHINQNTILSHLEPENIKNIMLSLSEDLVDKLKLNKRKWGITDDTNLDDINNCVLVNIFLALKRAEGQGEKNWLGKISIENISAGVKLPGMKKQGWLDKFKL